ncbi:MAG: arginine N-succinyltransferase, partial [Pseudomonadota bacterium]
FVMEELEEEKVVGTSCIVSKVGGFEPFYAYRIEDCVHESKTLGIRKEVGILHLVAEHSGPCEIGGLFLAPGRRKHGNGRLLSLFRFLFMTEYAERFEPLVIAEMRGVVDLEGRSPFWEALGRNFFDMDFPKADYLSVKDKRFIADLMPKCPIYISLLPEAAREVIGKVHKDTNPALKMLLDEGFTYSGMVDIFEAGPIIIVKLEDIRVVRESKTAIVDEAALDEIDSVDHIVSYPGDEFRACVGKVMMRPDGGALIERGTAFALRVKKGDRIRFAPLKPYSAPGSAP